MIAGLDPETLQGDLGRDPVAFARKRLGIARDLLTRLEARPLAADADPARLRRVVSFALRDDGHTAMLMRQLDGLRTLRDAPGTDAIRCSRCRWPSSAVRWSCCWASCCRRRR